MQRRSVETHNHILNTAIDLFSRSGYESTSVAEICQEAGVSKGAFYHHFPSKQDVFLELLSSWLELLDMQMTIIQEEAKNVPDALLNMAGLMEQMFQQASGRLPMFLEFWTQASHDPTVWKAVIAPYQRYQEYFKTLVNNGITDGTLKANNPEATSRTLVALGIGLLLLGVLEVREKQSMDIPSYSIKLLLEGIAEAKA